MSFAPMKLKPESGANRISSADDAYSFLAHLRLSYQSKPHWRVARKALDNVLLVKRRRTPGLANLLDGRVRGRLAGGLSPWVQATIRLAAFARRGCLRPPVAVGWMVGGSL